MPLLKIETTVVLSEEKQMALLASLSKAVAETIGKPERFQTFTFDGPHKYPLETQQRMMAWFDQWV